LRADTRSFAFNGCIFSFRYHTDVLENVTVLEGHRDIDSYFRDQA